MAQATFEMGKVMLGSMLLCGVGVLTQCDLLGSSGGGSEEPAISSASVEGSSGPQLSQGGGSSSRPASEAGGTSSAVRSSSGSGTSQAGGSSTGSLSSLAGFSFAFSSGMGFSMPGLSSHGSTGGSSASALSSASGFTAVVMSGGQTCIQYLGSSALIAANSLVQAGMGSAVASCPTDSRLGGCQTAGNDITYYYSPTYDTMITMMQASCTGGGKSWVN